MDFTFFHVTFTLKIIIAPFSSEYQHELLLMKLMFSWRNPCRICLPSPPAAFLGQGLMAFHAFPGPL